MSRPRSRLGEVTQHLPGGGEDRPGQRRMAELVGEAIAERSTVAVEAGTGTGKSFAYLTPVLAADARAVVATATIALQSQLAEADAPMVAEGLGRDDVDVAVLKGRSNYLCLQRLAELSRADRSEQLQLLGGRNPDDRIAAIVDWAAETATGDREELDPAPSPEVWSAVSVGADECPGAARCPQGDVCWAELARRRAADADVVVTNHHYYGLHLASSYELLPDHDVVVFDEAHQLPDTLGATCGTELSGGRIRALAAQARRLLTDVELAERLDGAAADLDARLRPQRGRAVALDAELVAVLVTGRDRVERVMAAARRIHPPSGSDAAARVERILVASTALIEAVDGVIAADDDDVLWVDGPDAAPMLRRTPLDVGPLLTERLWSDRAVVLTSATLADGVVARLGLDPAAQPVERLGSPFDFERQGLLYCPAHLPDPRHPDHRRHTHDEIAALATAAGGRTLALFTSYSAMQEAADALADRLPGPVLVQGEGSRQGLIERLRNEPGAVLLATMAFWQGVDVAGDALTVVTIDRLPFPRPDEPVSRTRRERAGADGFRTVDLPRAQTLLAQAAGRLIRRADDRGVVAVLDSRLATNRHYRWELIGALPPFRRTRDRAEACRWLEAIDADARAGPTGNR
ncbi:MAG: ATP-dependent DNA helicase [Acidimicrobiales bacterium]